MMRQVIYGRYGPNDTADIAVRSDETGTELNMLSPQNRLEHGMGNAVEDLTKMGLFPSGRAIDLLVLAAHVQAADTRVSRISQSQDSWTRELRIVVPVSDTVTWDKAAPTLTRALNFLTGDLWTVEFRALPDGIPNVVPTGTLPLEGIPFDEVALFSGGLDSLIGAVDMLRSGRTPLLISHAGDGTTSNVQADCYKKLKEIYKNNRFNRLRLWMDMTDVKIEGSHHEMTTRGRSFLFFAAGIFAGSGLNKPFILKVPENGLIALNVPLDPLRLGSHSTRTTHPFYIARWNELLEIIDIPGKIINPYWNKTKGEMVAECADKELLALLAPLSMSCSSPSKGRWQKLPAQHCGYCLPCLIRRAALSSGLSVGADKTAYTISDLKARVLESTDAEGKQVRSFQYAIHRLGTRPQLASILIHLNGSLGDESDKRQVELAQVYKRGLREVGLILEGVRTQAK